jgi:hypothetical protein
MTDSNIIAWSQADLHKYRIQISGVDAPTLFARATLPTPVLPDAVYAATPREHAGGAVRSFFVYKRFVLEGSGYK